MQQNVNIARFSIAGSALLLGAVLMTYFGQSNRVTISDSAISPKVAGFGFAPLETQLAQFDKYGGAISTQCPSGPRDHFYVERIGQKWWLCTPAGNVFWSAGVYLAQPDNETDAFGINHYDFVTARCASGPTNDGLLNWSSETVKRLKAWGFNTLDMYAYPWILPWPERRGSGEWPLDPATNTYSIPDKMPAVTPAIKPSAYSLFNDGGYLDQAVKDLMNGVKRSTYTGYRASIVDYYDSRFKSHMAAEWASDVWSHAPAANADWLLGVVVDDGDSLWWARQGPDFQTVPPGKHATHAGWVMLVTSPTLAAGWVYQRGVTVLFPDTKVYAKTQLKDWIAAKYRSASALNRSWGSAYTTLDSTGVDVRGEAVATGDGVTGTFSHVLARYAPSPFSIQVLVDGAPQLGDNGTGAFLGLPNVTVGAVNYANGSMTVVLNPTPRNGAEITVNYVSCGFGCGSGLLDEDGSHSWVPRVDSTNTLTGGNSRIRADLDELLYQYARYYFAAVKAQVGVSFPGSMYLGPSDMGGWDTPPRRQVLRAAGEYVDILRFDVIDPKVVPNDWADRVNFVAKWGGNKPWTIWIAGRANPDSYFSDDPRGASAGCTDTDFQTQADRGQWYKSVLNAYSAPAGDGIQHFVGVNFWRLIDDASQCANWGLMTRRDNPYDGVSAVQALGTDAWGYASGGEHRDYGDFISVARQANLSWVPAQPVQ